MAKSTIVRCVASGLGVCVFGYERPISFPEHSHNELALVICTEGALEMLQFGHREILHAGQILFTNSSVPHASRYCVEGTVTGGVTLEFNPLVLRHLGYDGASPYLYAKFLGTMNLPEIMGLARAIQDEVRRKEPDSHLLVIALARQLLILALRLWPRTLVRRHESIETVLLPRNEFVRSIELMQDISVSDFSVKDLARNLHRSTSAFSRMFTSSVGVSPYRYYLSTVMERAANRLATTEEPVKKIALDLGFKNVGHFSEAFRREWKMTPTAFRSSALISFEN